MQQYSNSGITCTTSEKIVYDVLMTTVLPESFKVAGLTAYIDGLLVATVSVVDPKIWTTV